MATIAEPHHHKPWSMARVIIASSAGTTFEWYDFFIFGSLAPVISKVFFAGLDPTPALIAALALFAVGFAFRPLGALIFGVIGDKLGRKGAFLVTVTLMGTATFLIGFLPTYAQAGTTGPDLADPPSHPPGHCAGRRIWRRGDLRRRTFAGEQARRLDRLDPVIRFVRPARRTCWSSSPPAQRSARTHSAPGAGESRSWSRLCCSRSRSGCAPSWPKAREFARLREEGDIAKAPLREAFGNRKNLKPVFIAFFGIMCAQGAVWYFTFFYMQVFLETLARRARGNEGPAADRDDGRQRPALCLFRLAQRPHRPQARDARRNASRAGDVFPGFALDRGGGEPARSSRRSNRRRSSSIPIPRPARCSSTRSAPPSS